MELMAGIEIPNTSPHQERQRALEEAALIAEGFARANINLNPNEDEATIASSVAQSIANQIRTLKS